ncbi:hypothetical protein LRS74_18430 [Streptomyces sp. LX-29]|uniref:hypothetical protein n=1 Tax=Streptomyces sp. LX-29 TaxID=2900152 RepID=UPI00240CF9B1|nr:hypothetical protein [Streptomyces sp. LX-29]WFB08799.1 hypothetical protein LRS74_18430 [Streptomyces sp. LX-29]
MSEQANVSNVSKVTHADASARGRSTVPTDTTGDVIEGLAASGADGLEEALLRVRGLIEAAVDLHRRNTVPATPLVPVSDAAAVHDALAQLVEQARHRLSITMPGGVERARPIMPLLPRISAIARSGIPVRILAHPRVLGPLGILSAVRRGNAGYEVRVLDIDLQGTVVADGKVAFGRSGPQDECVQASVILDPMAVRTLDLLFAANWGSARPLAEHLRLAERLHTDSARLILGRLRAGRTDDAAAREIQVSLRTYRRHVAAIMRDVGANSRFQAGVRAVELGLLAESD